jgi:ankyrin repeat protein
VSGDDELLIRAICDGGLAEVQRRLPRGCDADRRCCHGLTPLELAIEHLQLEVVRYLLDVGADANGRDALGQTPLHFAVDIEIDFAISRLDREGRAEPASTALTALLLELGADPLAANCNGETPLDWARQRGHSEAVVCMGRKLRGPV